MKTLDVSVTDKNIEDGERMTCCACPVARAINTDPREFPRREKASIHLKEGWFTLIPSAGVRGTIYRFELPEAVQKFVAAFQNKESVSPLDFTLKLRVHGEASFGASTL